VGGAKRLYEEAIEKLITEAIERNWTEDQLREAMGGYSGEDVTYAIDVVRRRREDADDSAA
jgi:hypothetical protein